MKIRDPIYILEAIKEKEKRKKLPKRKHSENQLRNKKQKNEEQSVDQENEEQGTAQEMKLISNTTKQNKIIINPTYIQEVIKEEKK